MIFLAVWLVVSLTYCAIILYSEKQNVQARERVNLSYAQHQLSTGLGGANQMDYLFLNDSNAIYFKDIMKKTCESQIIIAEKDTKKNIVNTADKTGVVFGVQPDMESSADVYGFVDYNKLCGPLSEKQLDEIAGYLRTKLSDGRKYELVCTKFHIRRDEYIHWIEADKVDNVFEEAEATEFDGEIVHQMPNGNWLVLVHDAKGAKFVYQTPLTPVESPKEFLKESVFYNEEGSICRCYDLYPNDRFEVSDLAFEGTPEVGAKIKSIKNKKMVIAASGEGGEGQGTDPTPTVTYEAVASPTGNPSTSGYYELVEGAYVASTDTEVDPTKTYYVAKQ